MIHLLGYVQKLFPRFFTSKTSINHPYLKLYNYSSNDFSFFNSLAGLLFFGSSQLFFQLTVTSDIFNSLASIILEVRLFVSNSQIPRVLI